jgi:glycosyltransferase involved in cell wall biosynthesis
MLPHREDLDGGPSWYHRMFSRCLKPRRKNRKSATLIEMARLEAEKLIKDDPQLSAIVHEGQGAAGDLDRQWEEFVNRLSSKVLVEFGRKTLDRLAGARLFDLFHSAGSAGALYALLAPYFVGFSLHASQRTWARQVEKHFSSENPANGNGSKPRRIRVAHFTDTFDEDNSVARTIRQSLESALQTSADYTILICAREGRTFQRGVRQFTSIGSFELPEYPELKVLCPPLLQMLNHCYEEDYTHIHIATPGPVGLAGLAIARILHLPVVGTYHTCLPQYAKVLTDDGYIEDILWRCMIWFYDQMDRVYVPSRATGRQLAGRGLTEEKIMVYPRGVDLDHFRPERRSSAARKELQLEEQKTVFIYAGRVCQEKNLHLISRAFRTLYEKGHPCQLLIAGDGPYRSKMESDLSETGAVFTGHLDGEKLADLYASSDVLVYPSANDTFGNAVLEAQASGIPVIVSDAGGPCENVIPGQTGLVVRAQNIEELTAAMEEMVLHPERRLKMGAAAREKMKKRDRIEAFREYWNLYTDFQRVENGEKHLTDSFLGAGLASEVSALAPEG